MDHTNNTLQVKIQRTDTKSDVFNVQVTEGMTVLNVLEIIYRHHDPTLAFRFSCRTGLCGTCTMRINGKPGLSCLQVAQASQDGYLTLAPLPKGETVKDLLKDI